jgi:hypothetical protein
MMMLFYSVAIELPAGFGYTRQFSFEGHVPEFHPAQSKPAHIPFWTACQLTPVMKAFFGGVAWQFIQFIPLAFGFQLLAQISVLGDQPDFLGLSCY